MRIVSPDWAAVSSTLQAWADGLVGVDASVLGVLLFGSLARGDHAPGSDADLLVVVDESPHSFRDRAERLAPLHLPICHETLVYTAYELRRLLDARNAFLARAIREGRWLAKQKDWVPPA